jgi:hypothetical protein
VMFYVENGGNGTAAAEAAGYGAPATAQYDCLKNPKIKEQIKRYAALCTRNAGESRETIIGREVNWAKAKINDYFNDVPLIAADGSPVLDASGQPATTTEMKPMSEWTDDQARRVKKISWNRNGPVLELHDPMRANRNLAEYNGLTQKEDQALGAEDAANLIAAALDRMDDLDGLTPTESET